MRHHQRETLETQARLLASIMAMGSRAIKPRRCIALLGDMLELGNSEQQAHRDMVNHALSLKFDLLGLVGPRYSAVANGIPNILCANDSDAMAKLLSTRIEGNEVILLKGSRGMKMEKILTHLKTL